MEINFFLIGSLIGLFIAAPVGTIGLLCINRTLSQGRLVGFVSGLGAATAHGIYGCIASSGLTFISDFLIEQQFWLRLIGGIFLCYLGIKTFISQPARQEVKVNQSGLIEAYLSTLILTITNPLTILSFVAVFAGLGLANTNTDYRSAIVLALGVFSGSAYWWFVLSGTVSLIRNKLNSRIFQLINKTSGLIISAFGLAVLSSLGKLV